MRELAGERWQRGRVRPVFEDTSRVVCTRSMTAAHPDRFFVQALPDGRQERRSARVTSRSGRRATYGFRGGCAVGKAALAVLSATVRVTPIWVT
ncbi:hypothetical protein [Streptomyces chartreusis]|uniref:hypothetical protein n=1 Tax=Streptomyces chartreusis TaxID=1969 RepID=UPI002E807319|nr:hypothetical protein [Streptomyces chartreusis]WUB23850.1 hypothetical protein OG997_44820 [Streptomyces chartreusis]